MTYRGHPQPERLRVSLGLEVRGLDSARGSEGARALGLDQQPADTQVCDQDVAARHLVIKGRRVPNRAPGEQVLDDVLGTPSPGPGVSAALGQALSPARQECRPRRLGALHPDMEAGKPGGRRRGHRDGRRVRRRRSIGPDDPRLSNQRAPEGTDRISTEAFTGLSSATFRPRFP